MYLIYYAWIENSIKWSDFNLQHEDELLLNGIGPFLLQVGGEREQRMLGKGLVGKA